MQVKVCQQNFTDGQFTVKTSKITSLENLYVYGRLMCVQIGVCFIRVFHKTALLNQPVCAWFLRIASVHECVCVCVFACVSALEAMNN